MYKVPIKIHSVITLQLYLVIKGSLISEEWHYQYKQAQCTSLPIIDSCKSLADCTKEREDCGNI